MCICTYIRQYMNLCQTVWYVKGHSRQTKKISYLFCQSLPTDYLYVYIYVYMCICVYIYVNVCICVRQCCT